jgi:hypothetical protein
MGTQIIIAIIGAVATIMSALGTRFVLRKYFPERSILATKPEKSEEEEAYKHLEGKWQQYNLTRDTSISSLPFWVQYEGELHIHQGRFVEGSIIGTKHHARLRYNIKGDIKYGKMILTYDCVQEPAEFATMIYPDLLNRELLVGALIGFDYQRNPIGSPVILSKNFRTAQELNEIVRTSKGWGYIQPNDHPLQPL